MKSTPGPPRTQKSPRHGYSYFMIDGLRTSAVERTRHRRATALPRSAVDTSLARNRRLVSHAWAPRSCSFCACFYYQCGSALIRILLALIQIERSSRPARHGQAASSGSGQWPVAWKSRKRREECTCLEARRQSKDRSSLDHGRIARPIQWRWKSRGRRGGRRLRLRRTKRCSTPVVGELGQ